MADEPITTGGEQEHSPPASEQAKEEGAVATAEEQPREEGAVATAEQPAGAAAEGEEKKEKLNQNVEIVDTGPCKKHIKVTIDRTSIDARMNDKYSELMKDAVVPGFRKGKAPRRIIERQFQKDVGVQVKGELLMASLEQLAEDHDIAPLAPPNLNPNKIEIPRTGPMIYEFDVEVRPQFDLPNYKGLKLRRPVRQFIDADVTREMKRLLASYGQMAPKDGPAELDDYVIADMTTRFQDRVIGEAKEITLRVDEQVAFKDGVAEDFGEQVIGASAGDTRTINIRMSNNVAAPALVGQRLAATLAIKDVKLLRLPELTHEFCHNFGVHSEEELREEVLRLLERRLQYRQRQEARVQILQQIETTQLELPQEMLMRQARRALNRRAIEMQEAGMNEEQIEAQLRLLQNDILRSTTLELREHFVLQKIAEVEKIDVKEEEIEQEIENMADETNESPRKVRARLEKEGQLETLAALIIERKALDLILASAEYEDVPLEQPKSESVALAEEQAVPGELRDPVGEAEQAEKERLEQEAKEAEQKETEQKDAKAESAGEQPTA
jgi:trigger factor